MTELPPFSVVIIQALKLDLPRAPARCPVAGWKLTLEPFSGLKFRHSPVQGGQKHAQAADEFDGRLARHDETTGIFGLAVGEDRPRSA